MADKPSIKLNGVEKNANFDAINYRNSNYYQVTPKASADAGQYSLTGGDKTLRSVTDTKIFAVQPDYYAGFDLGSLPIEAALGYPSKVPETIDPNWEMVIQQQSDFIKCVHLPDYASNPYLWGNVWEYNPDGGFQEVGEAFEDLYDMRVRVINGFGNIDRSVDVLGCIEPNPRFFYKATPSNVDGDVPSHVIVEIHAKEDIGGDWVTWFEFDKLVQYEYGVSMETAAAGAPYSDDYNPSWWRGAFSVELYRVGNGAAGETQEPDSYIRGLHPDMHWYVWIDNPNNYLYPFPDMNTTSYAGTKGYNTSVDILWEPTANPLATVEFELSDRMNGLPYEDIFPFDFTPYFKENVEPNMFSLTLDDIQGICNTPSFSILASDYLTRTLGAFGQNLSDVYYPGYILRRSSIPWHKKSETTVSDIDTFNPKSHDYNPAPRSYNYYQIELFPDATYETETVFLVLNGFKYHRQYLPNYGLIIQTVGVDDTYPMQIINVGRNTTPTINGAVVNIEDIIDEIVINYTELTEVVLGSSKMFLPKDKQYVLKPTSATRSCNFIWNDWAASGAAGGYRSLTALGLVDEVDTRSPMSMSGWNIGDFPTTKVTKTPWDNIKSFYVKFKPGVGTYSRGGEVTPYDRKYIFQEPALGAYD